MKKDVHLAPHEAEVRQLTPRLDHERLKLMQLLRGEFAVSENVTMEKQSLLILVPSSEYDRLGKLITTLHDFIESRMPERKNHFHIIIRELGGQRQNIFKFWNNKPA